MNVFVIFLVLSSMAVIQVDSIRHRFCFFNGRKLPYGTYGHAYSCNVVFYCGETGLNRVNNERCPPYSTCNNSELKCECNPGSEVVRSESNWIKECSAPTTTPIPTTTPAPTTTPIPTTTPAPTTTPTPTTTPAPATTQTPTTTPTITTPAPTTTPITTPAPTTTAIPTTTPAPTTTPTPTTTPAPTTTQTPTTTPTTTTTPAPTTTPTTTPASPTTNQCPDATWTLLDDNVCIKAFTQERKTWEDARKACQSYEGDLVEIEDRSRTIAITGLLKKPFKYWIGVISEDHSGNFKFATGPPLTSYKPWAYKEPNNKGGNEWCVEMKSNRRGSWNDKRCSKKRPFVCQKRLLSGVRLASRR